MSRLLRLTPPYLRNSDRLGIVSGSERGRSVGRTLAALSADVTLPGPGDTRALMPPTREAFVRPVPGRNLWIWYVVRDPTLKMIAGK